MATGVKGPKIDAHFTRMAKVIEGASFETVKKSADRAVAIQDKRITRDSGGDSKLSGVNAAKGRPGNTKVGVRVKFDKSKAAPSASIMATGPLQIINNDTAGHVIRSAYAKGRGRKGFVGPTIGGQFKGGGALNIPGIGWRKSVRHPGTKGKKTWQLGRKAAKPVISKSMRSRTFDVVKGAAKP